MPDDESNPLFLVTVREACGVVFHLVMLCESILLTSFLVSVLGELQDQGVEDVFVFCTRGELQKYRVPSLLDTYRQKGLRVHHMPFPDGGTPELDQCCQILEQLQSNLKNNRRTVIQ